MVYHGTNTDFDKFDLDKTAQGIIWFSEDRDKILRGESGANSSKKIVSAYLKVTNPASWDEYEPLTLGQIKQQGYDGIILDDDIVVFDPKQVRIVKKEDTDFSIMDPVNETFSPLDMHPELMVEEKKVLIPKTNIGKGSPWTEEQEITLLDNASIVVDSYETDNPRKTILLGKKLPVTFS